MSEEQQTQPQLALERIYTKDISFEVPGAQVFTKEWQPELNINLSSSAEKIDPTHFEVSLKVVVQANNAGDTAFIVDVTQSGIFLVDNVEEERLPYILGAYCPEFKKREKRRLKVHKDLIKNQSKRTQKQLVKGHNV